MPELEGQPNQSREAESYTESQSCLERYIWWNERPDNSPLSQEEIQDVNQFLQRIRQYQSTGSKLTIPLIGTHEELVQFVGNDVYKSDKLGALRKRIKNLPPFVNDAPLERKSHEFEEFDENLKEREKEWEDARAKGLTDFDFKEWRWRQVFRTMSQNRSTWARKILEIGKRLGTFPRKTPDNYLYRTPLGQHEYTPRGGLESNHIDAIYNCISSPSLGRNIYWHEISSGDDFSSYVTGLVVTVNKLFVPTNIGGIAGVINRIKDRF